MIPLLLSILALAFWAAFCSASIRGFLQIPRVDCETPGSAVAEPVGSVDIVFAARNEGNAVDACLRSLMAQDYDRASIVAVDDRSDDDTGHHMRALAGSSFQRLKVIRIETLPDGWLGKCHALGVGAAAGSSDWILFTDGDVVFAPWAVRQAVRAAESARADMLVLMPRVIAPTILEQAMMTVFAQAFWAKCRMWAVNGDKVGAYTGVGAFNLVRRAAYQAAGGHEPLRLQVVDDVGLGKLIKENGGRLRVAYGADAASVQWQESLGELIRGLEKNAFAASGYSVPRVIVSCVGLITAYTWPIIGSIAASGVAQGIAVGTLVGLMIPAVLVTAKFARLRPLAALLAPIGAVLTAYAIFRSMIMILRRGGVEWRGTFYPLDRLRDYPI